MFKIIFHYLSKSIFIFLIFFLPVKTYSQPLSDSLAKTFILEFINNSAELDKFVNPEELKLSQRLGITYNDVKNKFFISNDIPDEVRNKLISNELSYETQLNIVNDDLSILEFKIPSLSHTNTFYFYKSQLVSKPFYYSLNWKKIESEFYVFFISEPMHINSYTIRSLDSLTNEMTKILNLTEPEIQKLRQEKIYYFLCKDEDEIELLTNYKARGIYFIPYDYIITTYNFHFHEILHLLMNYKLKNLDLYTLPFFQEGFAVAYGGRGGIDRNVIMQMGAFISKSNFLDYKDILSKNTFSQIDASLSYSVSGLYTKFLIDNSGIEKFISLYKKYSGVINEIDNMKIDTSVLPPYSDWQKYSDHIIQQNSISVSGFNESDFKSIIESENYKIFENKDEYLFKIKNAISISAKDLLTDYQSKLFEELFQGKEYQNQKYIIIASADEVSVYNLYNNILIEKYVKGFYMKNETVIQKNGFFIFTIKKSVFDERIEIENVF